MKSMFGAIQISGGAVLSPRWAAIRRRFEAFCLLRLDRRQPFQSTFRSRFDPNTVVYEGRARSRLRTHLLGRDIVARNG
jgi:hypothetical protein